MAGLGVFDDVEQQFARRLEQQDTDLLAFGFGLGIDLNIDHQAAGLFHMPGKPLDGHHKPGFVQHRRTELDRQCPQFGDALAQHGVDLVDRLRRRGLIGIASPQRVQVQPGRVEELLQVIVKNLRQAAALAVLGLRQFGGQHLQLGGAARGHRRALNDPLLERLIERFELLLGLFSLHGVADGAGQIAAVAVPFEQEILGAPSDGFPGRGFVVQTGHHHDRQMRRHGVDLADRFDAPAVGQREVQ